MTTQRRNECVQDAAIAIDAASGDSLAERGVTSAIDVTRSVPAIRL